MYASEQDPPRIQGMRYELRQKLLSIDPRNLVFVDQSGVNAGYGTLVCALVCALLHEGNAQLGINRVILARMYRF